MELKVANILEEGRFGGPQARVTIVSEKLKKYGVNTLVIFPKENANVFLQKLKERDIDNLQLNLHPLTKQKYQLMKYFLCFLPGLLTLYRVIRKEGIDLVHCNGCWQFKGMIAGKLAKAKVVWHLNNTQTLMSIRAFYLFFSRTFADGFILSGERVRQYYFRGRSIRQKEISVIRPPVDTVVYDPNVVEAEKEIAQYDGIKIITVCNINPSKGLEYFIKMASILNREYNDLVFVIVGPHYDSQKKYSKELLSLAQKLNVDNLHFYGPSNDVAAVLQSADIFVCSSIMDAGPMTVFEAMAMGRPIVSTDVGDVSKLITHGVDGFVVPIKNPRALADYTLKLIENEELRVLFSRRIRDVALTHLDVNICAESHAAFYRKYYSKT